jgi:outer membrane immunogenic protein
LLVYGTGGLAYGKVDLSGNVQPANSGVAGFINAPIAWGQSTVKTGWTAGGGVEWLLDPHWSFKAEYLFMDLGTASAQLSGGIGTLDGSGQTGNCYGNAAECFFYRNPASGTITSRFTDNIVRAGLNYQFH